MSPGFSDHVPASCGNNLPHNLFLCEQHGTSGNSGHVPPRCSRRADRGEDVRELNAVTDGQIEAKMFGCVGGELSSKRCRKLRAF